MPLPVIGRIKRDDPEINTVWCAVYASALSVHGRAEAAISFANDAVERLLTAEEKEG